MRSHGVVDGTVLCNTYIVVLEGRTCNNNLLLVAVKLGLVLRNLRSPVLNFQHESLVLLVQLGMRLEQHGSEDIVPGG
jgi:hypothetical protein